MNHFDYMAQNPDAEIANGILLDHDMEYNEHNGWEYCNNCGQCEQDMDDVCSASIYALPDKTEWEDYDESLAVAL